MIITTRSKCDAVRRTGKGFDATTISRYTRRADIVSEAPQANPVVFGSRDERLAVGCASEGLHRFGMSPQDASEGVV